MSISTQGREIADLAKQVQAIDQSMRKHAEQLLFLQQKKEGLMVCLKQLAKELK